MPPPGAELDPIAIEPERELSAEERARAEAEAEERARLEAEATADAGEEEPVARSSPAVELPADARIQATGKRKSSIARVVLRPGKGSFEINSRSLEDYFPRHQHQALARQPLVTAGYEEAVDVRVRVRGGGISGQAGAVRHGVARALTEVDPELRGELKRRGLLTRDARAKERRKAGLKKARKRPAVLQALVGHRPPLRHRRRPRGRGRAAHGRAGDGAGPWRRRGGRRRAPPGPDRP